MNRFASPRRHSRPGRRPESTRLRFEKLEDRTLMSVDVATVFNGTAATRTGPTPPDPTGAAGIDFTVEVVNLTLTISRKDGSRLGGFDLTQFFAPLSGVLELSDPVIVFDEFTDQFVVGALDFNMTARQTRFDLAVSNDADPTDGFQFMRYDLNEGGPTFFLADYPKVGYNYDAYVFSFNMVGGLGSHVDTLAVNKLDLTDSHQVIVPGAGHFTLAPAVMHGSNPGDPMWLVERGALNQMRVAEMTGVLTDTPTFQFTNIPVDPYGAPPAPFQPGGTRLPTNGFDNRVLNAVYSNGLLLAAHTVGVGGLAQARWYEFDTTGDAPVLAQSGTISPGPGVYTIYPTIEINAEGDLGMTYMESSTSEYLSMYVTGQSYADAPGTMQAGVAVEPGLGVYTESRIGDYSGMSVDPTDGLTFWAVNEYRGTSTRWNTGIAAFTVSPDGSAPGAGLARLIAPAPAAEPRLDTPTFMSRQPGPDGSELDRLFALAGVSAQNRIGSADLFFPAARRKNTADGLLTGTVSEEGSIL